MNNNKKRKHDDDGNVIRNDNSNNENLYQIKAKIISIGPTTTAAIIKEKGCIMYEAKRQNISCLYDDLKKMIY